MIVSRDKIHPSCLGFDFDGVVADTAEAFIRLACEEYNYCDIRLEDITCFEVEKCLDIEQAIIEAIFLKILVDSVGIKLRPMDGAIEVLGDLSEKSVVTLVTARPNPRPVKDWLKQFMPPSTLLRINIVAMGSHDDKLHHIYKNSLTHFIDDRAETCLQLNNAGIKSFVFSQPWNRDHHFLPSVQNWSEIRKLCL